MLFSHLSLQNAASVHNKFENLILWFFKSHKTYLASTTKITTATTTKAIKTIIKTSIKI